MTRIALFASEQTVNLLQTKRGGGVLATHPPTLTVTRRNRAMARLDITDQRFGRLVALFREPLPNRNSFWRCICDCGREKSLRIGDLRRGETKSCGCTQYVKGHGGRRTRLYGIWSKMLWRCSNPNCGTYDRYGGRGITVCDEWKKDFAAFRVWATSHGYAEHLTIDRIDNDGPYAPGNCRWISQREQCLNKSDSRFLTHEGETLTLSEWATRYGLNHTCISRRIDRGWSVARALTQPPRVTR